MAKIMIIDDAAFIHFIYEKMLKKEGFEELITAKSAAEGIQKYKVEKPDVVFLDISMKEADGFFALEKIMEYDPKAKIIMSTAEGKKNTVIKSVSIGAKSFLVKPFKESDVLRVLYQVLQEE